MTPRSPDPMPPTTRLRWRTMRHTGGAAEHVAMTAERRSTAIRMVRESMRQGGIGVVADSRAFGADWGFTLGAVHAPVAVWQGRAHGLVPASHGVRLADGLPRGSLTRIPGAGHFLHPTRGGPIMSGGRDALDDAA